MNTIEIICTIIATAVTVGSFICIIFIKVFNLGKTIQHLNEFEKNVTNELSNINQKLNNLSCASHHDDITRIKSILIHEYPISVNIFSSKSSPRILNDLGMDILESIHGEDFLRENKYTLFNYIDNTHPLVALDVEQAALMACTSLTRTPAFNDIKNYIYNAPSIHLPNGQKYDISINDACFILSIPLRDMYLSEHKEINK